MNELIKRLTLKHVDIELDRGMIVLVAPSGTIGLMEQAAIDFYQCDFRARIVELELSSLLTTNEIIKGLMK